ncbi:hypothetical protein SKAU_G00137200 [Synaphobranchus kaupii]|uniref:HTH psq-type domain-containing protein n=1 Tax=Synaphobranchus kaupii TaxID=118154 RepID=A0A9Q1FRY5_SYNKA|nr:hypothetical protein SKAU_G00137200 [Synaphobranchus kaupii]
MLRAVEACKEGMSVRQAVRLYKVPRSTLADRVNGRVTHGAVSRPGQLLSKSDELSLVRYCQYMASHGHPLTKNQCFAFGTSIRRERDPNAQPLSRTWWRNFRQRRHVDLTMRTLEIIDRAHRRPQVLPPGETTLKPCFNCLRKQLDGGRWVYTCDNFSKREHPHRPAGRS